jgi:hypothetical protein
MCCAHDDFSGCGCDCEDPACWHCSNCGKDGHQEDGCPMPRDEDIGHGHSYGVDGETILCHAEPGMTCDDLFRPDDNLDDAGGKV